MNKRKTRQYNYCRNDNITSSWIQSTHVWRNLTFTSNTNHGDVNAILVDKTEVSSRKTAVVVHCCRARECDTRTKNEDTRSCELHRKGRETKQLTGESRSDDTRTEDRRTSAYLSALVSTRLILPRRRGLEQRCAARRYKSGASGDSLSIFIQNFPKLKGHTVVSKTVYLIRISTSYYFRLLYCTSSHISLTQRTLNTSHSAIWYCF